MPNAVAPVHIASAETPISVEHVGHEVAESHVTLPATQLPVEARGLALGILATLATVFALSWAQAFLVPLLLGIVIAYTLNPVVAWLEGARIPRAAGTVVVMAGVTAAMVLCAYSLRGQMQTIIEQLPEAATKFSTALSRVRKSQNDTLQIDPESCDRGGNRDDSCRRWRRGSAPACHSRHRGLAQVQARATTCGPVRWARSEPLDRRRWSSSWCSSCCSVAIPSSGSSCGSRGRRCRRERSRSISSTTSTVRSRSTC